jgi:hypothetical protein
MLTLMLAFLIVASLTGVSAGGVISGGSNVCSVEGNYTGVDPVYTQPRNLNFGTFSATALTWGPDHNVTATYSSDESIQIVIASNGSDRIAGIVGYFTNSTQSSPLVGGWIFPNYLSRNQEYNENDDCRFDWQCYLGFDCSSSGFSVFSFANESYESAPQSEVSLLWNFNEFEMTKFYPSRQNASTLFSVLLGWTFPYSGTLYWTLQSVRRPNSGWEFITTTEQIKAGLQGNGSEAYRSGNFTFGDRADYSFTLYDLAPHTYWQVYSYVEIINPPTISLQAYVLAGVLGNTSSQQLYRTVAGDSDNLVLRPATIPLPTRVSYVEFNTNVAYTAGPAMFLIALCLWLSSSQMF